MSKAGYLTRWAGVGCTGSQTVLRSQLFQAYLDLKEAARFGGMHRAQPRSANEDFSQVLTHIWGSTDFYHLTFPPSVTVSGDLEPLLPRWVAGLGKGKPSH